MKEQKIFIVYGSAVVILTAWAWWQVCVNPALVSEAYFFSVGQADASLVRTDGAHILIDAGKDSAIIDQLDAVTSFLHRRIDVLIVSHGEEDHIGGLVDVLRRYQVRCVVFNGQETPLWTHLQQTLHQLRIPVITLSAHDRISVGPASFSIVWPLRNAISGNLPSSQTNENSLVVYFTRKYFSMLFAGDISDTIEKKMLSQSLVPVATVLKVPHHGSKYSSSAAFLFAVAPLAAIIEVGKNSYGHPTQEVLSRLALINAHLYRTDINGTVRVLFGGTMIHILTQKQ